MAWKSAGINYSILHLLYLFCYFLPPPNLYLKKRLAGKKRNIVLKCPLAELLLKKDSEGQHLGMIEYGGGRRVTGGF